MRKTLPFLLLAALPASFLACKSSREDLQPAAPADYVQLKAGNYIIYRLDSTVFTNSGRTIEFHSYQERQLIDSPVTDAQGRPSWRVYRSLRDVSGNGPWSPAGTMLFTLTNGTYEVQEDNMRTLRLVSPVLLGTTWHGNQFVGPDPYQALLGQFDLDDDITQWNYTVSALKEDVTVNGKPYSGVATINIVDDKLLPDTLDVQNNSVQIPQGSKLVWLRGNATGSITLRPPATPPPGQQVSVFNHANQSAVLNGIQVPPTYGRNYEYVNNAWTYGSGTDTLFQYPPFGYRTYARDQYARGIGLITQDYILYQFDPNPGGTPFTKGFGVKRTILEHN